MSSPGNRLFKQIFLEMEDTEEMFICVECIRDETLRMRAGGLHTPRPCVSCGTFTEAALTPDRIARFIRKYLPSHFIVDDDLYPGYSLSLEDVIGHATGCSNETACKAIAAHMTDPNAAEDDFYCSGQEYRAAPSPFETEEDERGYVVGQWNRIAHELTHNRRFFNDNVRDFFDSLMYEAVNARSPDQPGESPVLRTVPPDTDFYRARIAKGLSELKIITDDPASQLGAPPKESAPNNRMSPAGIPLLYASAEPDTCVAEVRPSIGDFVVVGRFSSVSNLKFFDFTALASRLDHTPLSLFDPTYEKRFIHRRLLTYLHDEISKPVTAADTDYVVTQALAEFIRYDRQHNFDGVIFRSVQRPEGKNFVLFDKPPLDSMQALNRRSNFGLELLPDSVTVQEINPFVNDGA